jgi:CheY-like chemotaxis protein
MTWLLVDDSVEERASLARALQDLGIEVEAVPPSKYRERLGGTPVRGVLIDIDLSAESGVLNTGLGLAADIRARQKAGELSSVPLVRFARLAQVRHYIGVDTSHDDQFDLLLEKEFLSAGAIESRQEAVNNLNALAEVYGGTERGERIHELMGLTVDNWSLLGSHEFEKAFREASEPYLVARIVFRAMQEPGMLISEVLLSFRLGVDIKCNEWSSIKESLEVLRYKGIGSGHLLRYWARGLEDWWYDLNPDVRKPLAACTISERVDALRARFGSVRPLEMPEVSGGDRPWYYCSLTKEKEGRYLPVDPAKAVKFRSAFPLPDWIDPYYVAAGVAIRNSEDTRLDQRQLEELRKRTR